MIIGNVNLKRREVEKVTAQPDIFVTWQWHWLVKIQLEK